MSAQPSSTPTPPTPSAHPLEQRRQRPTPQREVEGLGAQPDDAEDLVRRLLHSLPTPIVTTDADGGILHSNPAASELLASTAAALLSTPVQAFVAAEDRPLARSLLARAGREGTVTARLRLVPREGSPREVHAVVTPCPCERGDRRLVVVLPAEGAVLPGEVDVARDAAPRSAGPAGGEPLRRVAALVQLAVTGASRHQLLAAVASAVTVAVPGAAAGSASTGEPAQPTDSAADGALAQAADGAQWAADEGPAALAHSTGEPAWTADLTRDERWPRLAQRAAGGGARAAVSVPLRDDDRVMGVVSAYGDAAGGPDVESAVAFAQAASAVLAAARRTADLESEVENLTLAMQSRAAIEQAKGAVASRLGCTAEEAFGAMVVMSQDRNVKVRDIGVLVAAAPSDRSLDEPLRAALERARQRTAARSRG